MGSVLTKSGQFICYKTGQFYLLLTALISESDLVALPVGP